MVLTAGDRRVLEFLRGQTPGPVTLAEIAAATGLRKVTVRACMNAIREQGLMCGAELAGQYGDDRYVIRHLHAAPG